MKKLIAFLLSAVIIACFVACDKSNNPVDTDPVKDTDTAKESETTPAPENTDTEETGKETFTWTREGYFMDEDFNYATILPSEDEEHPGWEVSLGLDGDIYSWFLTQEGNALRGNMISEEIGGEFIVTITEDDSIGVFVETQDGKKYHLLGEEKDDSLISLKVGVEGLGEIACAMNGEAIEFEEDFTVQMIARNFSEPETVVLAARPEAGYQFLKWTKDGEDFSTENPLEVEITESSDFTAVFEYLYDAPSVYLYTDGGGQVAYAENEDDIMFSEDHPIEFDFFHVEPDTKLVFVAMAYENWEFVKWTMNGEDYSDSIRIEVTVSEDVELTAVFEDTSNYLDVYVNAEGSGQVTFADFGKTIDFDYENPAQSILINGEAGEKFILGALADKGWGFVKWTKDGEDFSTSEFVEIEVEADVEYTAVFEMLPETEKPASVEIKLKTEGQGRITYSLDGAAIEFNEDFPVRESTFTVEAGGVAVICAEPDDGWYFVKWTMNGEDFTYMLAEQIPTNSDAEFVAIFNEVISDGGEGAE